MRPKLTSRIPVMHGLICATLLLALTGGCGKQPEPGSSLDVSQVPVSDQLERPLAEAHKALAGPLRQNSCTQDLAKYSELLLKIGQVATRESAGDELYALWRERPQNPLLLELAIGQERKLHRAEKLAAGLSHPALADTNRAPGLYVRGRMANSLAEKRRYYLQAEFKRGELDSLQQSWLIRRMAYVFDRSGATDDAISLLISELPLARSVGGCFLEMWYWQDLTSYLLKKRRLDDALHAAVTAVEMAKRIGDDYRTEYCRAKLANVLSLRGEDEAALVILAETSETARRLDHPRTRAISLEQTMAILAQQGAYERAIAAGQQRIAWDLSHGDWTNAMGAMMSVANYYRRLGAQDSCRVYLDRVRQLLPAHPDARISQYLMLNLANYHFQIGEFSTVDSLLAATRDLDQADESLDLQAQALLMMIHQGLQMGRPAVVYQTIAQLEEISPRLFDALPDRNLLAEVQLTLADFYAAQGEFVLARESLAKAHSIVAKRDDSRFLWKYHWGMGKLAYVRDDLAAAREEFSTCRELAHELGDPDLIAQSLFHLGRTHLTEGDYRQAYDLFQAECDSIGDWNFRANLASRIFLGESLFRMGRVQEARDQLNRTAELLTRHPPLNLVVELHLQQGLTAAALGQLTTAEEHLLTARRFLREAGMGTQGGEIFLGVDQYRKTIEALICLYQDHPRLIKDGKLAQRTLLLAEECRWSVSLLSEEEMTPKALRSLLRTLEDPVLAYLVGENRSFIWVIAHGDITLHSLPGQAELGRRLTPVLADMRHPDQNVDWVAAGRLGALLLGPLDDSWPSDTVLRIIPDEILASVPWWALPYPGQDKRGAVNDMLAHGPVAEVPSLASLLKRRDEAPRSSAASGTLLAIGVNGVGTNGNGAMPLREAEAEARQVAALWPADKVVLKLGQAARWNEIARLDLQRFSAIHLATHAEIHQGLPSRTTLKLSEGDRSAHLTVTAVGDLHLKADLVYLSCCSAAKRSRGSGGLINFARAFLHAGAKAVIASSSRVDDDAAAYLAARFFLYYSSGRSRAVALRSALHDLREANERWRHPHYWGFYRLIERR